MVLHELKLHNFKNYLETKLSFNSGINCILGKNGMGKTNLLDAIYMTAMTKSALNLTDQQVANHEAGFYAIHATYIIQSDPLVVSLYAEKGRKKMMKVNGVEVQKMSDHIGQIPCVITTPDDSAIIQEGSEIRRRLFDMVISQCDRQHLQALMDYQRILKQRNGLLKGGQADATLLDVYDEKLVPLCRQIAERRYQFCIDFLPFFEKNYQSIFKGKEHVGIQFESDALRPDFTTRFRANRKRDEILQRTELGIHKDDFQFFLNELPIRKFGSQGQQKSFVIALKLAEYDFLKANRNVDPVLLLDDIFDKLDNERIEHLVNLLADSTRFSQLFITDARSEQTREFFKAVDHVTFMEIKNGALL